METLLAIGTVLLLVLACAGLGTTVLRVVGVRDELTTERRLAWSFSVGFGALGWVIFFPAATGFLTPPVLIALCAVCAGGLYSFGSLPGLKRPDAVGWLLLSVLIFVLFVDILEGLSPPADADTLAYHFTLPKRHLAEGGLFVIPRAVDGILPQLLHMTYVAALGIGGEKALTLWAMVSGWATAALLFDLCRGQIGVKWSLALTLVYLSTPAVLQTGGAGHIEPRVAQFVLIAAVSAGLAVNRSKPGYAALAGLCAGFFAASKYTGVLFGISVAIALLIGSGRGRRLFWFGLFAFAAAVQWYLWIWVQTGDPVFPMLYNILGAKPGLWSAALNEHFLRYVEIERPFPRSLWWFFAYPVYATFVNAQIVESGRTGLGILPFLLLPFAAGWLATGWRRDLRSPLFIVGLIMLLSYAFWFFGGAPQRVRHLLPLYPTILACLAIPAVRLATGHGFIRPLVAAFALCIGLQTAGQAVYGRNYAIHMFSNETRSAYFERNVSFSSVVAWFNRTRQANEKLLVFHRELLYLVDPPVVLSHAMIQQRYNFVLSGDHPDRLLKELRDAGITHILLSNVWTDKKSAAAPGSIEDLLPAHGRALRKLADAGCLMLVHSEKFAPIGSRTLPDPARADFQGGVLRLVDQGCRL